MMGAVFAMQGFGQLGGALIMLFVTLGFKNSLIGVNNYAHCTGDCSVAVDKMWRILIGVNHFSTHCICNTNVYFLGMGAVPACIALYYRLTIPETPRYTFDVARDIEKAQEDVKAYMKGKAEGSPDAQTQLRGLQSAGALEVPKASWTDFFSFYGKWRNGKILLGTAASWFLLDVAFYGLGLNSSTVLTAIGYGTGPNVYTILYNLAVGNCILVCAGAIPGYWVTVATVDTIGRKPIQLAGFIILTILFIVWGFDFGNLSGNASLALYVLVQFFFNFGKYPTLSSPFNLRRADMFYRSKRNDIYCARRMFPNTLSINIARYLCSLWQSRVHHCSSGYRSPSHKRCERQRRSQPMAKPRHANLRALHVLGYLLDSSDPRDQAYHSREIGWRV